MAHIREITHTHQDGKSVKLALSSYEEMLFKKLMAKGAIEKAQASSVNDSPECLSYLFGIFR